MDSFRDNARRRKGTERSNMSPNRGDVKGKIKDLANSAPPLGVSELMKAKRECIKLAQRVSYAQELSDLSRDKANTVRKTSSLLKLAPFVDEDGLLRVGERLSKIDLPPDSKHPVVLHPANILTERIVWHEHVKHHARPERLLADIRTEYWVVTGRRAVRRIANRCVKCKRLFSQPVIQIMANLPSDRLAVYKHPFTNTGVDYFGPLRVKIGRRVEKRWICLFTCLTVRAVHLEIVHSLSAASFIMAFQRFINRRGKPSIMRSDNGTNFVAANRELHEQLAERDIQWMFNPPGASHFGGVWERLIRSCRTAMLVIMGDRSVTEEVLATVIGEVEMLLNSRPLTHVSVDPNDPAPLTPNHFLSPARPSLHHNLVPSNADDVISRHQMKVAQALVLVFWKRWLKEYAPHLTERRKWQRNEANLKLGDVVLIIDENSPRGHWPWGRIVDVHEADDGVIRSVTVKTAAGEYRRPVAKLCLLATDSPDAVGNRQ